MKLSILKLSVIAALLATPVAAYSQTSNTASILPPAKTTFLDKNGKPLAAGTVDFYIPGTTTRKMTWQDAGQTVPNTNPVVLDTSGRGIILGDGSYRQVVKDKNGNVIWDQITSSTGTSGGGGGGSATIGDGQPVGSIQSWAGFIAPYAYVFAYGQELARASFPDLYNNITLVRNVSCTFGNPALTNITDTTQIPIGADVESPCLNQSAKVVSKTVSSIVVDKDAIITTSASARIFPWGNGDGSLTFEIPDLRGRVLAGRDNMGSISANRLTLAGSNCDGQATGSSCGNQNVSIIGSNNVAASGNTSFSAVQPSTMINYIIKTIPDSNPNSYFGVASIGNMTGVITCGTGLSCSGNNISVIPFIPSQSTSNIYSTAVSLANISISSDVNSITTLGYYSVGDSPAATRVRSSVVPASQCYVQSLDGAYWELAEHSITPEMCGAIGNGVTDDAAKINAAVQYLWTKYKGGVITFLQKTYLIASPIFIENQISLIGQSAGGGQNPNNISYIRYTGNTYAIVSSHINNVTPYVTIKNLTIYSPNSNQSVINGTSFQWAIIENNTILGNGSAGSIGIYISAFFTSANISNITQASSAVVTANSHPFSNGDIVYLSDILGMTQLNNRYFVVSNVTTNTFTINQDTTSYSPYSSGGTAKELTTDSNYNRITGNYIGLVSDGIYVTGQFNSSTVRANRIQPEANGVGFYVDSTFSAFPNNVIFSENVVETSSNNVTGVYVASLVGSGVVIEKNRFELSGTGTTAINYAASHPLYMNSNYYEGGNITKLIDPLNLATGDDESLLGWRVVYQVNTQTIVSGSNFGVTAIGYTGVGDYTVFYPTLSNVLRFIPKITVVGNAMCYINNYTTSQLRINCINPTTNTPIDPTALYLENSSK